MIFNTKTDLVETLFDSGALPELITDSFTAILGLIIKLSKTIIVTTTNNISMMSD
jgi:hypothetical protein